MVYRGAMSKFNISQNGFAAATLLTALFIAGCTGTGGGVDTSPTQTQSESEMADLKATVQTALGSTTNLGLAAVGNYRKVGFTNTPLLSGAPDEVRLIVACSGGGESKVQAGADKATVACDSMAHVIEKVQSKSLTISVPADTASQGSVYVVVDKP